MKCAKVILTVLATVHALSLGAETIVVPAGAEGVEGPDGISAPFRDGGRTMQMVFEAADLAAMPVGSVITGLTFRLDGSANSFPTTDITFANYDIWLEWPQARLPGASLSTNFAENMTASAVMVRAGPLTIPADSFPAGAAPNAFGYIIPFTSPTTNQGGDMILTLRHSGNGSQFVFIDRVRTSTGILAGYATSYTGTTMVRDPGGGPLITQFAYTLPVVTEVPPVIGCPQPLVLTTDPGTNVASNVSWSVSVEPSNAALVCLPPSGSTFPLGTNVVTCLASNSAGTAVCQFLVLVEDQEAPVISHIVANTQPFPSPNHKFVSVSLDVIGDDNSGEVEAEIVQVIPLGSSGKDPLSYEITGPLTVTLEVGKSHQPEDAAYKIVVRAVDSSGNTTDETIIVYTPKDKHQAARRHPRHSKNQGRFGHS